MTDNVVSNSISIFDASRGEEREVMQNNTLPGQETSYETQIEVINIAENTARENQTTERSDAPLIHDHQ